MVPLSTQVPLPSQVSALFWVVPLAQLFGWHTVPDAYSAHAPAPSQLPFSPQPATAAAVHSLSGSVFEATAPHVPLTPLPFLTALHAWQVPLQAVSQQ